MERERTRELRGQEEGRRDGERKDIDFHLKEAISASQELQGLSVCVCACVCVCVCAVCMICPGISAETGDTGGDIKHTHIHTHRFGMLMMLKKVKRAEHKTKYHL